MITDPILRILPRKALYALITALLGGVVYLGGARVKAAENAAYGSKARAEEARRKAQDASINAEKALGMAIQTAAEVREVRAAIEEMHREQLQFYRWQAQQAGDWQRENRYASRLKDLGPPSKED